MKFYPYGKQDIDDDDIQAVADALKSDLITQGPSIMQFEQELAKYFGAKYAIVLNSGTSALHAIYFALGLQPGDELITSPNTFVATANAGLYLGGKPVFADVEPHTGNINASAIEPLITSKTKLLVPVHYAGKPADMEAIHRLAVKYNLAVVEDGCHAAGAVYQGKPVGSCVFSDATMFSFHPVKNLTTAEGGVVLTNREDVYDKVSMFRTHGITKSNLQHSNVGPWYYEMHHLGFNYRMTDLQAALGSSQLKKLPGFIRQRRLIADWYRKLFRDNPYFHLPMPDEESSLSAYHLFFIRLNSDWKSRKKEVFQAFRDHQLGVQVHYIPVPSQPYYQQLGYNTNTVTNAVNFYEEEISLPMYPGLKEEDVKEIANRIFSIFEELS
jgi:UDP-4-amino-4,6-dideoxy-L-N-acetyl-beta-L-altrosamine transaminase